MMSLPSESSVERPVRALVIGAGTTTVLMHLPVLAELRDKGDVVLALVCDIERERAAAARRKFGFLEDSGDGVAALERHDIDAVYIFGSAQLHYEYGLAALQSGKHLFVEKPIAPSYAQACKLAETARIRGLVAVGGHNRRFYRSLAAVRAHAGKARWRFAEAVFHKPEYGRPPPFGARSWLGANGIHGLDALVFMMDGLPDQLTALVGDESGTEPSVFSAIMRWRDGGQGVFLCTNNAGSRREEYVFHGFGETYSVAGTGLTIEKDGAAEIIPFPSIGDGFAAEHDSFLYAIRSGVEPPHSITTIAPSLFLAELIEDGFSGRVQLPQIAPPNDLPPRSRAGKSILVTQTVGLLPALARLLPHYRLVSVEDVRRSTDERPDIVAAILGRGSSALAPDILAKLPQLAIVGVVGLSLGRHAPEVLLARGIALVNASAAEPFFLELWRAAKPLVEAPDGRAVEARDLKGTTVGLIGWGAIAQVFAEHLAGAHARVLVYSENAAEADIRTTGATPVSLSEALAADIVSLHRGLTNNTRHCLGKAELAKLRPGAILINVARGALIEPAALLARLKQGDIFACLDTYEEEPLAASHPLRSLPNVFLTSHIAGGSRDMHAAAAEEVVRKVAVYLRGDRIESISAQHLRTMT